MLSIFNWTSWPWKMMLSLLLDMFKHPSLGFRDVQNGFLHWRDREWVIAIGRVRAWARHTPAENRFNSDADTLHWLRRNKHNKLIWLVHSLSCCFRQSKLLLFDGRSQWLHYWTGAQSADLVHLCDIHAGTIYLCILLAVVSIPYAWISERD